MKIGKWKLENTKLRTDPVKKVLPFSKKDLRTYIYVCVIYGLVSCGLLSSKWARLRQIEEWRKKKRSKREGRIF